MSRVSTKTNQHSFPNWLDDTELVSLVFELTSEAEAILYPQYTVGLHAWFLDQVRSFDPELSAYLHNGESEKPFTISQLDGTLISSMNNLRLLSNQTYRWYVSALSQRVVQWLTDWLRNLPKAITLRTCSLQIQAVQLAHPAITYHKLFSQASTGSVKLSFLTPTSFRRKGHHFPFPVPNNVFHSYLRRWNDFSGMSFDQNMFLEWVDNHVVVTRHRIESMKVAAGKRGMVTGFTGAVEFDLPSSKDSNPEFEQLFYALTQLAPYCGTGHKTTFGLGQTRLGWFEQEVVLPSVQYILAQRIEELTAIFVAQRKRISCERTDAIAQKWATILARREMGDSLQNIAVDLEMPYETVKTYVKLARRKLKNPE